MDYLKQTRLSVVILFVLSLHGASSRDLNVSTSLGAYGNDVFLRQYRQAAANKMWLVSDRPLPAGLLVEFYIYLHPGTDADGDDSSLKLQIYRQTSENPNMYLLVFEKAVTVDTTSPDGQFQTFSVTSDNTFYTEQDDFIGWTTERTDGIISLDIDENRATKFRHLPSTPSSPGTQYEFGAIELSGVYSIAVKINTQISCEDVRAPTCQAAQHMSYNTTSYPNFFGHTNQNDAIAGMQLNQAIINTECDVRLDEFLCSLYIPKCSSSKLPCASVCASIKENCMATMESQGLSWPTVWDCSRFPTDVTCDMIGCEDHQYTCRNEKCIFSSYVCDGQADCDDASDENMDMCLNMPCRDDQFNCVSNRANGLFPACIHRDLVCDDDDDCLDGEDEAEEQMCDVEVTCPTDAFMCEDGTCIPESLYCDHMSDCRSANDEEGCTYVECTEHEYKCHSNQCIDKTLQCNGIWDCSDGTDERTSTGHPRDECNMECNPVDHFRCGSGDCVPNGLLCNGIDDCIDDSDEDALVCGPGGTLGHNDCASSPCQETCHETLTSYYCTCQPGFDVGPDGTSCLDINECSLEPLKCGQKCTNTDGNYTCSCEAGYSPMTSDPSACSTAPGSVQGWIIFCNQLFIRHFDLEDGTLSSVSDVHQLTHVLDYDYNQQRIYYADARLRKIWSMSFDGTDIQVVNQQQTVSVEGIAVDWVGENIYWTSASLNGVYAAKTNGLYVSHLVKDVSDYPRGLALDPREGWLFSTDWSLQAFIGRVGMDGSGFTKLITESIFWPNGITIDYATKRIFWIDAHLNRVESADYNGDLRSVVVEDAAHGYALTVFEETVYWSEWNIQQIEKANKRTGEDRDVIVQLAHNPFGIKVVHPLMQPGLPSHPCMTDNGGCSQLCLIAPGENKRTCACARYFELQADNVTCVGQCNAAQFECEAPDSKCIPMRWFCDGEADCAGGDDEPADHHDCLTRVCPPGYHQCENATISPQCTLPSQVCDTQEQCADQSDEDPIMCNARVCAPYQFRCESGQCLPQSYECDGEADCEDASDENDCKSSCDNDEFTCNNGLCIDQLWVCDYDDDCGDKSDEPSEWCWNNTRCPDGWERCRSNYRCIPLVAFCNGQDNCRDNSDEERDRCPGCDIGDYTCDNFECIPLRWRCDFGEDCSDGSDEGLERGCDPIYANCTEIEFKCNDRRCIRQDQRCDFVNHCPDGEDEVDCANHTGCGDEKFQCASGHCIPTLYECDQYADCEDGSDEHKSKCPAPYDNGVYCPTDRFECAETGICVPPDYQCDGYDDCFDNSDELNCDDWLCNGLNRFHCASGHCIYHQQVCDGIADCEKGEDEATGTDSACHPDTCAHNQFTCTDLTCIAKPLRCNKEADCADLSDEMNCFNTTHGRCDTNNGGCAGKCNNLGSGNYYCSCDLPGTSVSPRSPLDCQDLNECEEYMANNCTQMCNNYEKGYDCQCAYGFVSPSGRQDTDCTPDGTYLEYYAFVGNAHELHQYYFSDDAVGPAVIGQRGVDGIDVDIVNRYVYYADASQHKLFRSAIPSSIDDLGNGQDLDVKGDPLLSPSGIAYEWKGRLVFWSDNSKMMIGVVTHDGNYRKDIVTGDSSFRPFNVIVDSEIGHLYWINRGPNVTTIEKSWTNGADRGTIVGTDLIQPTGLAVDHHQNHRIFWTDRIKMTIESVNYDGSDRATLYRAVQDVPFGLDVFGSSVLYTSKTAEAVYMRSKKADGTSQSRALVGMTLHSVSQVRFYSPLLYDTASNQCELNGRARCSYLCFVLPEGHHVCECPDGAPSRPGGRGSSQCDVTHIAYSPKPDPVLCTCSGHGHCTILTSGVASCVCDAGYVGDNCAYTRTDTSTTTTTTTTTTPTTTTGEGQEVSPPKKHKSNKSDNTTAIVVPVFIIIILLVAVAVGVLFWMHKRGKLGKGRHGRYERDPTLDGSAYDDPGVESAEGTNMTPIQFENGGNVRFSNPMYDTPEKSKEEFSGQGYVTDSDVKLVVNEGSNS